MGLCDVGEESMSEEDILSIVKYPHLDRLERLYPGPQVLLGKDITWTLKEDGSNIGIALVDGIPEIRSRNQDRAAKDFYTAIMGCPQWNGIVDILESASEWNDEYVLFGELCMKGRSPTRIKIHEETSFLPFDLWSKKANGFFNYTKLYQECYHSNLPCAELMGSCNVVSIESLYDFESVMLQNVKDRNEEGVVGKVYLGSESIYFKSKNDTPRPVKDSKIEYGRVILPPLPESEIYGAIEKARADIGDDAFKDIKMAMPLVAKYVSIEGKHHMCETPRNLFEYYQNRVRDI